MEWFSENWVWVLFFAGMIAMHMFGHGGHGGHGGKSDGGRNDSGPQAKTMCNAVRKNRIINIDRYMRF